MNLEQVKSHAEAEEILHGAMRSGSWYFNAENKTLEMLSAPIRDVSLLDGKFEFANEITTQDLRALGCPVDLPPSQWREQAIEIRKTAFIAGEINYDPGYFIRRFKLQSA